MPDERAPGASSAGAGGLSALTASHDPFRIFRTADVGVPPRGGAPSEPNAAYGRGVVWFTGNSSVAYSIDRGASFTMLDPSTVLPDAGLPFCCDQIVVYSPRYDIFVWLTQYWCTAGTSAPPSTDCRVANTGSNRLRIAVATPGGIRATTANPSRAWTYWDLPPSLFGLPGGTWFDRNEMAVGRSTVAFQTNPNRNRGGSMLARISLAELAQRGAINISYAFDDQQNQHPSHGTGDTTYFAGIDGANANRVRIWSWEEGSNVLFRHGIDHTATPVSNSVMPTTTGGDWYDRYPTFPGHVESSTLSGDQLWVAYGTGRAYCTSQCATPSPTLNQVFPQPAIQLVVVNVRTWQRVRERWLWNPTLGFGFPALATNENGQVGITFVHSAVPGNPLPVAGILTPHEEFVSPLPSSLPLEAGDYYSLRPGPTARSFAIAGNTVEADPTGNAMHWRYIEYGFGAGPTIFPPFVSIEEPLNGSTFLTHQAITYRASVRDPQDGTLPQDAIVWREDGREIGRGERITRSGTAPGDHTIQVTATNGSGRSTSVEIRIRVQAPAPPGQSSITLNCPPDAERTQPFQVSGALSPPHVGVPIRVTYTQTGTTTTHNVSTDANSEYSDSFTTNSLGDVTVQAHFDGDGDHAPSSSPSCTVQIFDVPP